MPCGCGRPGTPRQGAWVEGSGGGCCFSSCCSRFGRPCLESRVPRRETSRSSWALTAARTSSAARGVGCGPRRVPRLQHRARRRATFPGAAAAANAGRLRGSRVDRQRGPVCALSPASSRGACRKACINGIFLLRVSLAAIPKRVDGNPSCTRSGASSSSHSCSPSCSTSSAGADQMAGDCGVLGEQGADVTSTALAVRAPEFLPSGSRMRRSRASMRRRRSISSLALRSLSLRSPREARQRWRAPLQRSSMFPEALPA